MTASTDNRSAGLGIGAGIAAGVVGAIVWALITNATNNRIGFLAIAAGALVGFAVGKLGRGPADGPLPIIAAVIALVSVAVGDTFGWASSSSDAAHQAGVDISSLDLVKGLITGSIDVLGQDLPVREIYRDDFSFFVLVFIALGVATAFQVCRGLLAQAEAPVPPTAAPGTPFGEPTGAPHGDPTGTPAAGQPPYGQVDGMTDAPIEGQPPAPPSFEKRPDQR